MDGATLSLEARKLTLYFNEQLRAPGGLAADLLLAEFARTGIEVSVLLRGVEGFGTHHLMHSERFENTSLNQPLVVVAVDRAERIGEIMPEASRLVSSGLVTSERAWLLDSADLPGLAHDAVRLSVYCGRSNGVARPPYRPVVDHLRACGFEGATVFLGVDGTMRGRRERARFFSANRDVPVMILAVGSRAAAVRALERLADVVPDPIVTAEGVQICKRQGELIAPPPPAADGLLKVMIHSGSESLHYNLLEELRHTGAAGATTLRGVWGYRGDKAPHGDSARSFRRTSPVVTTVIDGAGQIAASWAVIDRLTRDRGLVTCEVVPR